MWLGGVHRSVGRRARVGFHAAYVTTDGRKQEVGSGNALVGSYLNRLGLADAAVVYLTAAPPDGAAWLTDTMARQLGIRAEFGSTQLLDRLALASPQAPASMPDATPAPVPAPALGSRSPSPGDLMADLYRNFPWSVRIPNGETCVGRPCKVRMVAADAWTGNDGVERRLVIGAAEVRDDCHACSAIMGVGVFRLEGGSWRKEAANPAVTRFGAWGVFQGKVTFLDGGALGRVVMTEESGVGQGVVDSIAEIFVTTGSGYRSSIIIPISHNLGGFCDIKEPDCQKRAAEENYDSALRVQPGDDGTLRIVQTFTAAFPIPPAAWVVDKAGAARQTGGGNASPGGGAQERAMIEAPASPAIGQGRADRVQYEAWFNGLQGDARAGAESWVGRRSLRAPGSCAPPPGQSVQWSSGCAAARAMLSPPDSRRKADPDYRRGWNSL